jgi:hypothetical protein
MTVNELINALQTVRATRPDAGDMDVNIWLPGSRITLDGATAWVHLKDTAGNPLRAPIVCVEGEIAPGSVLAIVA